jgi:hypothetical protein
VPTRHRQPGGARPRPALSWWVVAGALLLVVTVSWGATSWLLQIAATAKDVAAAQVDAIKTGLGIGAGTGGVLALLLAVRRQWHQELSAQDTVLDATERRVTELYTKAADQLGSDKAPVRLAGLYALERLAQANPTQRQTVVNVLCAYLRMPYQPSPLNKAAADRTAVERERRVQEREVRLTAQRILAEHLLPGSDPDHPVATFWADSDLNLTGAALVDFDMHDCWSRTARFSGATFTGDAEFDGVAFTKSARFNGATFTKNGGAGAALGAARFAGKPGLTQFLPPGLRWAPEDGSGWRTAIPAESGTDSGSSADDRAEPPPLTG